MDLIVLRVMERYICSKYRDRIPGGLADKGVPKGVDPGQVVKGIKVEREHTSDPDIAREITYDHLTEDPEYYTKLENVERGLHRLRRGLTLDQIVIKVASRFKLALDGMDEIPESLIPLYQHI